MTGFSHGYKFTIDKFVKVILPMRICSDFVNKSKNSFLKYLCLTDIARAVLLNHC